MPYLIQIILGVPKRISLHHKFEHHSYVLFSQFYYHPHIFSFENCLNSSHSNKILFL